MTGGATLAGRRLRLPPALYRGVLGFAAFFVVAELVTRLELVDPQYLPYASTVAERIVDLLGNGEFMADAWATVYAWAISLGLATLIAVPLGILLGSSNVTYRATAAVVEVMRPIPAVALIPLAILVWVREPR